MIRKLSVLSLSFLILQCVHSQQFKVSYTANTFEGPFSGKVFLYLSKDNKEPRTGNVGIEFFPSMSIDVNNVKPGVMVVFDDKASSFPVKLSEIERGEYYAQIVWDRNLGGRAISQSPGNMFSKSEKITLTKDFLKTFTISCAEKVAEPVFKETQFVKELKAPSTLLSTFHRKPMTVDAAVILPVEYYKDPQRSFPVVFNVSGYGGDYHFYSGDTVSRSRPLDSIPVIMINLDGNCSLGHSVYANSDNNGPWGDALTKEFIPLLEKKFRCNGARFLRGHSSGGWTVLYLQSHYPTMFAGCWSSSPDPVDFRDYQKVNLYEKENLLYDKKGNPRMVGTVAGMIPWASSKQAYQAERVIYRGEQMHSFDAVFSARGTDGNPERICDPFTGAMNEKTFEHWKNYDLSLYLRNNWDKLKKDLDGKIRVTVGEQDNFLLNGAVHLLDKEMKALNANMSFEYFPGDHFTVGTPEYREKGLKFLAEKYKEWQKINLKGF
jgi:S-formylglutathione hydrolase FrmB